MQQCTTKATLLVRPREVNGLFHSSTHRAVTRVPRKGCERPRSLGFRDNMYHQPPPMPVAGDTPPKKRRPQVKLACMNCRRQHAGCNESRPCERCIRLGLATTCEDMPRKKRSRKRVHLGADDDDDFEALTDLTSGAFSVLVFCECSSGGVRSSRWQ